MEKLIASAIQFKMAGSGEIIIMTGKRHTDIFTMMRNHSIEYLRSSAIQGFWTNTNRFVDRYEAKKIAIAANQLIVPVERVHKYLFSEDVW